MKHKTIAQVKIDLSDNLKRIRTEMGLAQERLALEAEHLAPDKQQDAETKNPLHS